MRVPYLHRGLMLVAVICLVMPLSACAQTTNNLTQRSAVANGAQENNPYQLEDPVMTEAGILSALEQGGIGELKFQDAPGMKAFYEVRNFDPVWIENSFYKNRKIEEILSVLEESWTHGLNPNHYNISQIRELMEKTKKAERYQLDLTVSDALVRYGRDMSAMRIDPKRIGQRSQYWRKPLRAIDVLDYASSHSDVREALENIAPRGELYKKLQAELKRLYKMPSTSGVPTVKITRSLLPGTSDKAILSVRRRMGLEVNKDDKADYIYDEELTKTIRVFQKSHGVTPDGIIGPQTVGLMNISRDKMLRQVLANLERLRWVEQNKPERYIMVNVPSATLWAVENGDVKIEMPVVVGRSERATNIFTTRVDGIRFNPTWTVPPTIKKDDYLPKLRKNPYYLSDRGIEIKKGSKTVDPGTIDWKNKTWSEVNAMRMVKGSGPSNPLGRVRFLMNNPFNIYLHDTPNKSYFAKADRALSSGCVRLERPVELADFVLKNKTGWTVEQRKEVMGEGKMRDIYTDNKLPVYILYQTVWLGEGNQIIYGADIYGHDDTLIQALKEIDGVAVPQGDVAAKTALNTK